MKFRPCIDLHNGIVKQIVGQTLSNSQCQDPVTNFESTQSSLYFATLYKRDDLKGGHVIMLGPGNETAAISALNAFPGGFHIGGGITPDTAALYLDQGASHVIITSYVFKDGKINWGNLDRCVASIGKNRLILDLSCVYSHNTYYIATNRWQKVSNEIVSEKNLVKLSHYCDEFLIHAIEKEGKQQGVDIQLISLLAQISPIMVTYAGGVRTIDDIKRIYTWGKGRIDYTVGSALDIFGGKLPYSTVLSQHHKYIKP